eukprot:1516676-Amphidinium_carterae.1
MKKDFVMRLRIVISLRMDSVCNVFNSMVEQSLGICASSASPSLLASIRPLVARVSAIIVSGIHHKMYTALLVRWASSSLKAKLLYVQYAPISRMEKPRNQ